MGIIEGLPQSIYDAADKLGGQEMADAVENEVVEVAKRSHKQMTKIALKSEDSSVFIGVLMKYIALAAADLYHHLPPDLGITKLEWSDTMSKKLGSDIDATIDLWGAEDEKR